MRKIITEKLFDFSKTQNLLAFLFYTAFITALFTVNAPFIFKIILGIFLFIIFVLGTDIFFKNIEKLEDLSSKFNFKRLKKITTELTFFIPVLILDIIITTFLMKGMPANQESLEMQATSTPIFYIVMMVVIIAPIYEEYIFRYLPYQFIKNKKLYVIISAFIFAGMHVIYDPNPFYYIWFYMISSVYFSYRYYKTEDILVTISLHSFGNLIAILL